MADGKLPHTTLVNVTCAARQARSAHGNAHGEWLAISHYSSEFQLRHAPGAQRTWQRQWQMAAYLTLP
eukprot:6848901-Karenia_brevis.AAC.1